MLMIYIFSLVTVAASLRVTVLPQAMEVVQDYNTRTTITLTCLTDIRTKYDVAWKVLRYEHTMMVGTYYITHNTSEATVQGNVLVLERVYGNCKMRYKCIVITSDRQQIESDNEVRECVTPLRCPESCDTGHTLECMSYFHERTLTRRDISLTNCGHQKFRCNERVYKFIGKCSSCYSRHSITFRDCNAKRTCVAASDTESQCVCDNQPFIHGANCDIKVGNNSDVLKLQLIGYYHNLTKESHELQLLRQKIVIYVKRFCSHGYLTIPGINHCGYIRYGSCHNRLESPWPLNTSSVFFEKISYPYPGSNRVEVTVIQEISENCFIAYNLIQFNAYLRTQQPRNLPFLLHHLQDRDGKDVPMLKPHQPTQVPKPDQSDSNVPTTYLAVGSIGLLSLALLFVVYFMWTKIREKRRRYLTEATAARSTRAGDMSETDEIQLEVMRATHGRPIAYITNYKDITDVLHPPPYSAVDERTTSPPPLYEEAVSSFSGPSAVLRNPYT